MAPCPPEVGVRAVGQLVDALLQRPAGPVDGEVDVLQEHPAALLVGVRQVLHRDGLLRCGRSRGQRQNHVSQAATPRAARCEKQGMQGRLLPFPCCPSPPPHLALAERDAVVLSVLRGEAQPAPGQVAWTFDGVNPAAMTIIPTRPAQPSPTALVTHLRPSASTLPATSTPCAERKGERVCSSCKAYSSPCSVPEPFLPSLPGWPTHRREEDKDGDARLGVLQRALQGVGLAGHVLLACT